MSAVPPRFACDVMLGRTARWLRMLGLDTFYDNKADDAELKDLCLREDRVLLTKDMALHGSMPVGTSHLVNAVHPRQQMEEIVAFFRLDRFPLPSRCSVCNGELDAIGKDRIRELVPPFVFRTQNRFQRCRQCKKIYWPGSHIGKISRFIEAFRKASG